MATAPTVTQSREIPQAVAPNGRQFWHHIGAAREDLLTYLEQIVQESMRLLPTTAAKAANSPANKSAITSLGVPDQSRPETTVFVSRTTRIR